MSTSTSGSPRSRGPARMTLRPKPVVPAAPTWDAWAQIVLDEATRPGARVLIDGRSGSGKSTLAARVVTLAHEHGLALQCVHVEDIYPGWDGLAAGSAIVADGVLGPLVTHATATWPTHDWYADAPGPPASATADQPLLVEGTGAITPASARLATWTVWVEADADLRRQRALARDGERYRPHWQRWADQEDVHLAQNDPRRLADLVIDAATIAEPASTWGSRSSTPGSDGV